MDAIPSINSFCARRFTIFINLQNLQGSEDGVMDAIPSIKSFCGQPGNGEQIMDAIPSIQSFCGCRLGAVVCARLEERASGNVETAAEERVDAIDEHLLLSILGNSATKASALCNSEV